MIAIRIIIVVQEPKILENYRKSLFSPLLIIWNLGNKWIFENFRLLYNSYPEVMIVLFKLSLLVLNSFYAYRQVKLVFV